MGKSAAGEFDTVQEVDSNPLKKRSGFLNGVGAKRSGNGSAAG
jgi:hypothetical protein